MSDKESVLRREIRSLNNVIAESIANAAVAKVSQNYYCIGGRALGKKRSRQLTRHLRALFIEKKKLALATMK